MRIRFPLNVAIRSLTCGFAGLFPCLLAFLYSIVALVAGWDWLFAGHGHAFYGQFNGFPHPLMALTAIVVFHALLGIVVARFSERANYHPHITVLSLFLVTIAIRICVLNCLSVPEPETDSRLAWMRACGQSLPEDYHSFFPYWMNYSLPLRLLVFVCGPTPMAYLSLGIVSQGITAVMIFGSSGMTVGQFAPHKFN